MVTREVIYFGFKFDFCEKYTTYMVEKAINSGASQQAIEVIRQQMREMKVILDNPLLNAAVTFTEPFPVGLLITLISAAILRKKRTMGDGLADESGYGTAQARTSDAN